MHEAGEYAALAGLHVEERDLPPLVGEHERAQAPAADKDHSGAPRPGALNMAARVEFHAAAALREEGPLAKVEVSPKWNDFGQVLFDIRHRARRDHRHPFASGMFCPYGIGRLDRAGSKMG